MRDRPAQGPWYVVGDFNLILSANEKKGGRLFRPAEGVELSRFMSNGGCLMLVSLAIVSLGVIIDSGVPAFGSVWIDY